MTKQNETMQQGNENALQSLKNNPTAKWMTIGFCALIIAVGGWLAYNQFVVKPADEKAQTQLSTGMQLMGQAQQYITQNAQIQSMTDSALVETLKTQGMITTTNPDSIAIAVKQFRDEQQKSANEFYDKALKGDGKFPGLLKIAKGSGNAANMATYLAGVAYYHMGQYKEAISHLEDFSPKGDAGVSPMALAALAHSYACDNQLDKAIAAFKEAADEADNESLSPLYLIEAGKLLESQNKKAEAHELYEEIKAEYPQHGMNQQGMMSSEIDKYIERTK